MTDTIFTIGHSTHPVDNFIEMLKSFDIEALVDIRTIPKSRYNPQFSQDLLAPSLASENIEYYYMKDLGGLRHAKKIHQTRAGETRLFAGMRIICKPRIFRMHYRNSLNLEGITVSP